MDELSNHGSRAPRGKAARQAAPAAAADSSSDDKRSRKKLLDEIAELRRQLNAKDALDPLRKAHESAGTKQRVQYLLAVSPAIIYTTQASGDFTCTFVSQNLRAIMGYSPEEMTTDPKCWPGHLHPEDAPRVFEEMRPLIERGGVLWTYMGPPQFRPPLPEFEFAMVGPKQRYISKRIQECNYLQAMEGGIDSCHVGFLHSGSVETDPLSVKRSFNFPEGIGPMNIYLLYHEELESIARHFPKLKRARFWMTFSENYLNHLRVLQNVGMTRIDPVRFQGVDIVPIQFLKALLPDPASLGPLTKGRTCIGCVATGTKDGKKKTAFIYNICDHEACYREVQSQAISYTTGVPAAVGAEMMLTGKWRGKGVFNMEQFDPDPFLEVIGPRGLPWKVMPLNAAME